jgi:hypothetical protein
VQFPWYPKVSRSWSQGWHKPVATWWISQWQLGGIYCPPGSPYRVLRWWWQSNQRVHPHYTAASGCGSGFRGLDLLHRRHIDDTTIQCRSLCVVSSTTASLYMGSCSKSNVLLMSPMKLPQYSFHFAPGKNYLGSLVPPVISWLPVKLQHPISYQGVPTIPVTLIGGTAVSNILPLGMLYSLHFLQNGPHATVIWFLLQGRIVPVTWGDTSNNSYLQAAWLSYDFLAVSTCLEAGSSKQRISTGVLPPLITEPSSISRE